MSLDIKKCQNCGEVVHVYKTPFVTVDIIIEMENNKIVLINRANPPKGWALPGGYVDYGESLESAAIREAKEETSLDIRLIRQFHTYSDPKRDPRQHNISTVFIAKGDGVAEADSDAKDIGLFGEEDLPDRIVFDHPKILDDYFKNRY
jgi:ADP-ribose pyrophosphatase YjhB (NUDIX family)